MPPIAASTSQAAPAAALGVETHGKPLALEKSEAPQPEPEAFAIPKRAG